MPESGNWERDVLEKLVLASIKEQRRARQWSIFFRLLLFAFLFIVLFGALGWLGTGIPVGKHTALVNLDGEIGADQVSADRIIKGLDDAFKDKNTKGVILAINSPGGSPVQAGYINDEIWRLRRKYPKIPIYTVAEDLCASGGYYVAVATDRIYVNKATLIGSIGVLMDGFGFTGLMNKLGIERRLLIAGKNKGFLDPFSPEDPTQVAYAKTMLQDIHQQFIQAVRKGRGNRLKETPGLFSGLIWTGDQSIALGLADGYGSVQSVARDVIKAPTIVDYTPQGGFVNRFAKHFGAALVNDLLPLARSGLTLR
ncbi:MAG: S49 family peptidase [Betaproteobacteria bacterium]|nr:S49 family peptidase [Betaproteobacteria bacterium]